MGLRKLGAGCPTGPAMSPGRRLGLGGTCASPLASHIQHLLPVHRQPYGSRRSGPGCVPTGIPDIGKLPLRARRVCDLGNQRDAEFADRPLPEDEARSDYRFAGRCDAGGGEQRGFGAAAGSAGVAGRVERASAESFDSAFTGIARGGNLARLAAIGVCRDSECAVGAGRHGEVADQSRKDRTGTHPATNGSAASMNRMRIFVTPGIVRAEFTSLVGGKP